MSVARGASALGRLTPSRSARLSVAGLGTALLVALAGGCTSNAETSPLPEPTVSASPSPSASPTPPEHPAEAEGTTPKAAKAFARFWVETMNYAAATGDTSRADSVTTPRCDSCNEMLTRIAEVYAAGGEFRGEGWSVRQLRYQPFQPRRQPVVSVGIRVSPQVLIASEGSKPHTYDGGRNQLNLHLVFARAGWKVDALERLS